MSSSSAEQSSESSALLLGLVLSLAFITWAPSAWGADSYSMETVRARASAHFPQILVDAVRPQGFRVVRNAADEAGEKDKDDADKDDEKTAICEVFWARSVAAGETQTEKSKAIYGGLKRGSLVGVIHFLIAQRYVRDYRAQVFKAGYYTMRYAVKPEGVDETEPVDYVLLSPVSADRNPARSLAINELVRHAQMASGGKRPATMSLVETDSDYAFPSLATDDEGTSTLQVKLPIRSAKNAARKLLPLALVVVTAIPEDLGD